MATSAALLWLDGRACEGEEREPERYAPGVFESLRCARGQAFFLAAHLARMERGARLAELPWPPPWDPRALLLAAARAAPPASHGLRLAWTPPHLVLTRRALVPIPSEPAAVLLAPGRAAPPRPFGAKSTLRRGYDERRAEAEAGGAFEALVQAADGNLLEGTFTNLFVVLGEELLTPPLAAGTLPGTARAALLAELSRAPLDALGHPLRVAERPIAGLDLARAGEVLLTNCLLGVVGVSRILGELRREDLPGPRGPVARALRGRFERLEDESAPAGILGAPPG